MASQEWIKFPQDDLWIKCHFKEDSYCIWLTDLCQLYLEELDGDDLRWRAAKAKLPIDVDEAHNLSTLLKSLAKSVEDGELETSSLSKTSRYMDVQATVKLPKPLPDAQWTFKLELQPEEKFRESVSKPLLSRIDALRQQEEDLIQRLHDKDHVIERLLDTLEKHSIDLADVFPSLASHGATRRNDNRQDAESHLPALKAFDANVWHEAARRDIGEGKGQSGEATRQVVKDQRKQDTSNANTHTGSNAKGIKRTLGGKKTMATKQASSTPKPDQEEYSEAPETPPSARKQQGIRRTLGGSKPVASPKTLPPKEPAQAEADKTSSARHNGIKRSLGHRSAQPGPQQDFCAPIKDSDGPDKDNVDMKSPDGDKEPETALNDDELANEKRATLKRQFATAAANKTKKRRF